MNSLHAHQAVSAAWMRGIQPGPGSAGTRGALPAAALPRDVADHHVVTRRAGQLRSFSCDGGCHPTRGHSPIYTLDLLGSRPRAAGSPRPLSAHVRSALPGQRGTTSGDRRCHGKCGANSACDRKRTPFPRMATAFSESGIPGCPCTPHQGFPSIHLWSRCGGGEARPVSTLLKRERDGSSLARPSSRGELLR